MMAHLTVPPPRPSLVAPGVPAGFDEVIARGMAKDVTARYQSIDDLAHAARTALNPPPVTQMWHTPVPAPTQRAFAPVSYAPPPAPPRTSWWRRKSVVITTALLAVVAIAVTTVVLTTGTSQPLPDAPPDTVTVAGATYAPQTDLNSDGLTDIKAITTNQSGSVIGLCCMSSLFKLQNTGQPATVVPLNLMVGTAPSIAVDDQGNGYLALTDDSVVRMDGALNQTKLPFPPTELAQAIAVDAAGDVFVLRMKTVPTTVLEVWKLDFGAPAAVLLPFDNPSAKFMAVAPDGTVYVDNVNSGTILKLAPGANRPTGLPLPHQKGSDAPVIPRGLAADGDGAVYVAASGTDGNLVYRYGPNEKSAETLPITGLTWEEGSRAIGVAVDGDGNVFVVNKEVDTIVKLPRVKE